MIEICMTEINKSIRVLHAIYLVAMPYDEVWCTRSQLSKKSHFNAIYFSCQVINRETIKKMFSSI